MRTFNQWMDEYGVSHKNPVNQLIHKICVPFIMLSVIGFLWCLPRLTIFNQVPYMNWGVLFVAACLGFYLTLNFMMFVGMFLQVFIMCVICQKIYATGNLLLFSTVVFILSWIAQFYGHKIEGKKPSFLQDVTFLLIGPLWVTRFFYKRIGLNV